MNKILGAVMVCVFVLLFAVYAYGVHDQQRFLLGLVTSKSSSQQQLIDQLRQDVDALNSKVSDQDASFKVAVQKIEQFQKELLASRGSIAEIKEDLQSFKKDGLFWQKEYVATLLKVETRIDELDKSLAGFESELAQSILPELQQQIDVLRKDFLTANHPGLSASQSVPSQSALP